MNNPQVSIIIPVYKAEKYIQACVESVLQQTFTDFELILVNDGSPDASGKIIDELAEKDSRIRVFHQKNAGPGAARNLGLENAKGEFINFVDADDMLVPDFLESYQMINKEFDCVFQGYQELTNKGEGDKKYCKEGSTNNSSFEEVFISIYESGMLGFTCLKQFRSSIIKNNKIKFRTGIKYREDFLFTIEYLSFGKRICITENTGYLYRVDNPNSLLHTCYNSEEYLLVNDLINKIIKERYIKYPLITQTLNQEYANNNYLGIKSLVRYNKRNGYCSDKEVLYIKKMISFYEKVPLTIPYSRNTLVNIVFKMVWKTKSARIIDAVMRLCLC